MTMYNDGEMEDGLLQRKIELETKCLVERKKQLDDCKACMVARELDKLWEEFLGERGAWFFTSEAFYNSKMPDPDQRNGKMQEIILKYFAEGPPTEERRKK